MLVTYLLQFMFAVIGVQLFKVKPFFYKQKKIHAHNLFSNL